ncbi:zf-HC2 domain-containing protein [Paenibacillus sp.]|jgi:hypothetical protein|uniref:anti-sigma factor family protein n=1 Tax=Paenibacillus sp. TaxID=58172 RepID=UPI00283866AA|nr:zf-HC2 domain-containing protein [Paenibacillus sp.]MDR0269020.1 zf-HC2 domain-containing protein [Paenibacillus sp.]
MNCPEVVEWMHRYLDYDLSEDETVQLYEHLKHCPECTETFRMLKSLSRDLEDLPQVTPKFSIVDAIMPQLDAIDMARQEKSASREEAPAEMVPVPVGPVRTSKFRNSVAGRTAMGAVAAAIILGVAIYTYPSKHLSTAEEPTVKGAEQVSVSTSSSDGIQGSGGGQQTVEPKQEAYSSSDVQDTSVGSSGGNTGQDPTGSHKEQPLTTEVPSGKADEKKALSTDGEKSAVEEKSTVGEKSTDGDKVSRKTTVSEAPAAGTPDVGAQVKAENPDHDAPATAAASQDKATSDNNVGSGDGESNYNISGDIRNNIASVTSVDGQDDKNQDQVTKVDNTTPATISATIPNQINSPDGKYTASVEDNKLVIYSISDSDGQKKAMKKFDLPGNWISGVWSADSTVFTYQTSDSQGATASKTYRVDSTDSANP